MTARHADVTAALFAVLVSGTAVLILRETPWPWDPIFYMETAAAYQTPAEIPFEHRALRWGLLLPLSLVQSFLGYTEASYYTFPIAAVSLLALAVFVLARRVMGPWWAGVAAVVATTNPIVISRSSHPFPDVAATALVTLGIAALLWVDRTTPTRQWMLAAAAGLCFGSAYSMRESVVVLLPVVVACVIFVRISLPHATFLVLTSLLVLGLEFLLMNEWFGNPLARFDAILHRHTEIRPISDPARLAATSSFQGSLSLSLSAWYRRWNMIQGLGLAPLLGAVGAGWLSIRSRKHSKPFWKLMLTWLVSGWIVFAFMGMLRNVRGGFVFNLLQVRYWYVLVPPVAVGVVGMLHWASTQALRLRVLDETVRLGMLMQVAAAGLCFVLMVGSYGIGVQVIGGYSGMHEAREWLAQSENSFETIAASPETESVAQLFTVDSFGSPVWDGEFVDLLSARTPDLYMISWEDKDLEPIAVDGSRVDLTSPPDNWIAEFVASSGKLAILRIDKTARTLEVGPSSGPKLPFSLTANSRSSAEWLFRLSGQTPSRYRIAFNGTVPDVTCIVSTADSVVYVPSAHADTSTISTGHADVIDFFCPRSSKRLGGVRIHQGVPEGTVIASINRLTLSQAEASSGSP